MARGMGCEKALGRAFATALTAAGVEHDVKEYPGAGHGFLNDHEGAGDKVPLLLAVVGRLSGASYHEASAQDARRRILAFFDAHLKAAEGGP